jgi:hypothetical protein
MAELRITKVEPNLVAQLKSKAALAGTTLRLYILEVLGRHISRTKG